MNKITKLFWTLWLVTLLSWSITAQTKKHLLEFVYKPYISQTEDEKRNPSCIDTPRKKENIDSIMTIMENKSVKEQLNDILAIYNIPLLDSAYTDEESYQYLLDHQNTIDSINELEQLNAKERNSFSMRSVKSQKDPQEMFYDSVWSEVYNKLSKLEKIRLKSLERSMLWEWTLYNKNWKTDTSYLALRFDKINNPSQKDILHDRIKIQNRIQKNYSIIYESYKSKNIIDWENTNNIPLHTVEIIEEIDNLLFKIYFNDNK